GTLASVPGPVARAAGTVLCQAAIEWISRDETSQAQASQTAIAQVPGVDPTVRAKPGQELGRYANIVARTHCAHVALHQIQWHHGRIPHQDGDALAPGLRLQELQELPHESLGSMRLERCDQPGLMSDRPPFMG